MPLTGGAQYRRRPGLCKRILHTMGPGLMVCFADTDGPCLITAAQSGAEFGYALLSLQLVLIPVLFFAQELTVRLGLFRGKGIIGLLKEDVGSIWAWIVAVPLLASCVLGLISEYTVIAATMAFFHIPEWATCSVITVVLSLLAFSGKYEVAEKVGLTFGACQILLFITMFMAKPVGSEVVHGFSEIDLHDKEFVKLITANIGAVIMPWMLAYQQSALCDKGLIEDPIEHLYIERADTFIGSFLTQGVMAAMLVTVGAMRKQLGIAKVESVDDLLVMFTAILGSETGAKWFLCFSIVGACMVAAIVQTLCASYVFQEAMAPASEPSQRNDDGISLHSSTASPEKFTRKPQFYIFYVAICIGAFIFTVATDLTVDLSIYTEYVNGILMPPVVFGLWYLAAYSLPTEHKLSTWYKWFLFVVFLACSSFCIASIFLG